MKKLLGFAIVLLLLLPAAAWASGTAETTAPTGEAKGKNWIADGVEITYWTDLSSRTAATRASHNEVPVYQEAEKLTGIKVKFLHPPAGQTTEQFNLMMASGDLADVISYSWLTIPGGPEKAVADKAILKINDLVKQHAPAIGGYLNSRPDIAKKVVTDQGSLYQVPFLRPWIKDESESWQRYSTSPHFRLDWLEEMKLELPRTIEEWEPVLTAIKGRGANIIPLTAIPSGSAKAIWGLRWFLSAWGSNYDTYMADGKVRFGPAEPSFKEWLTVMNRWYKNGLIDPDFVTRDYATVRSMVLEGRVGVYWGLLNRDMGGFSGLAAKANHPTFKLMAAPWPYAKDGKSYNMAGDGANDYPGGGAAISTRNKYPVESIKWLNFWWTEEGHNLANFGIEGLTYNWVNGFPQYTDLIMKNPDGLSVVNALSKYAPDGGSGRAWRQDSRYWQQMMALPQQYESGQMLVTTGDVSRCLFPTTPTVDESREEASLLNEINTYRDEMTVKFIVGVEPLSKFDDYLKRINSMGVPRVLQIEQAALDRYEKRAVPKF